MNLLLRRAAKTGLVYREHGVYRINREKAEQVRFEEYRNRFISLYDAIIHDLVRFAGIRYSVTWSAEDAEAALHDYLSTNSITLFQSIYKNTYVPLPKPASKTQRYVFASYVNHLVENKSQHLDSLQVVLEGHMLATAIFLPDPSSTRTKFQRTSVFFDTRFLINALSYSGYSLAAPRKELLYILYEFGADLCCFDHTIDEISSVLRSCGMNLRKGSAFSGYGPTFENFLTKGFSESDVILYADRLEADLERLRIETRTKPAYLSELMIDESLLEKCISSRISYSNPYALKRDIDSISAVARIRAGNRPRLIERSGAIFVTSNIPLVEAANEFAGLEEESHLAPLAISDWDLTNLMWLKKPVTAPTLPRKRLIADCYAAVQPSERFRHRYLQEVEKLASIKDYRPEDVYALRHSLEAQKLALEATAGDEDAFTEGTVQEILSMYQVRLKSEEHAARQAAERHAQELTKVVHAQRAQNQVRIFQIEQRATIVSRTISGVMLIVLVALAAGALFFTLPDVRSSENKLLGLPINYLAAGLVGVLSLANWTWGTTLVWIRRQVELSIYPFVDKLFKWMGGIQMSLPPNEGLEADANPRGEIS